MRWRAIRWALVAETIVMVVAVTAAALAVDEDSETMPVWPLLLLVIPVAAALRESLRRSRDALAVMRDLGTTMMAVFVTGLAQLPLIYPLWLMDENTVPYAVVAIVLALIIGGLTLLALLLMIGGAVAFARLAPLGTSPVHRSLGALLFAFLLVTSFGIALGTDGPHGRGILTLFALLTVAEPTSPFWLWTGRVGALGLIGVVVLLFEAGWRRRRATRTREQVSGS